MNLLAALPGFDVQPDHSELISLGDEAYDAHSFCEAAKYYREATKNCALPTEETVYARMQLAAALKHLERYREGLAVLVETLSLIFREGPGSAAEMTVTVQRQMAELYERMNHPELAEELYQRALKTCERNQIEPIRMANVLIDQGAFFLRVGQLDAALASTLDCLIIRLEHLELDHSDVRRTYWALAMIYEKLGDTEQSDYCYKMALPPKQLAA